MKGIAEIKDFARKAWSRGDVLRSAATGEPQFPLRLRFKKASGQQVVDSLVEVQQWLSELNASSKKLGGFGFTVEFSEVNHRKLGRQRLPSDIRFDTPDDLVRFIGKQREFTAFLKALETTKKRISEVALWMTENPMKVVPHLDDWNKILDVCKFVQSRPKPGIYLRQITLSGIDTKFFEAKRSILSDVLTCLLTADAYDASITGLSRYGFERRFGFLYDEAIIRYRILDDGILAGSFYRDLSMPLSEFAEHDIPGCHTVFVTENKVNGLAFPTFKGGVVVFGLGYGIGDIATATWLRNKRVIYWGDIDTHGYGILSMLRGKLPHVESILMTSQDIDLNRNAAVVEPNGTRRLDNLENLTPDEESAYFRLLPGGDCEGVRIEQERVPYYLLLEKLDEIRH
ncbi:hypothetical protein SAMN05660420_01472 [Desulfuromusa kysingii]|uniref:Wadjet protein JetD C-terminal domain-containing protein n=1 Tax=Desulfuromusa kysingii TaxID=37625 RepID=A0A1H3Z1F1_9BACT|nr:DUF3322 domain-containing protein [Desulfuromusa kysingii]SEA17248.1 hypothetical protein SAMN05660420_01472 [Desulfuromusa kysingii]